MYHTQYYFVHLYFNVDIMYYSHEHSQRGEILYFIVVDRQIDNFLEKNEFNLKI